MFSDNCSNTRPPQPAGVRHRPGMQSAVGTHLPGAFRDFRSYARRSPVGKPEVTPIGANRQWSLRAAVPHAAGRSARAVLHQQGPHPRLRVTWSTRLLRTASPTRSQRARASPADLRCSVRRTGISTSNDVYQGNSPVQFAPAPSRRGTTVSTIPGDMAVVPSRRSVDAPKPVAFRRPPSMAAGLNGCGRPSDTRAMQPRLRRSGRQMELMKACEYAPEVHGNGSPSRRRSGLASRDGSLLAGRLHRTLPGGVRVVRSPAPAVGRPGPAAADSCVRRAPRVVVDRPAEPPVDRRAAWPRLALAGTLCLGVATISVAATPAVGASDRATPRSGSLRVPTSSPRGVPRRRTDARSTSTPERLPVPSARHRPLAG